MPVSLGTVSIAAMYLGTTAISAAYLGTTQVLGGSFSPSSLFAASEPGFWSEVSTSVLWTDTARTTQVTATSQAVASWALTTAGGTIYATQATATSRPIYALMPPSGKRNLLTFSEQFNNAAWLVFGGASKTGTNVAVAPDGTTTADSVRVTTAGTGSNVYQLPTYTVAAVPYTFSCYVKRNAASNQTFQLFNNFQNAQSSSGNLTATDTWQRFSHTSTSAAGSGAMLVGIIGNTSGAQADLLVWGAQLELGSTATTYQTVTNQYDVTEAGVASLPCLSFDGVDDFLVTSTLTPGTDKAQVLAGVRKLSDAAAGAVAELSASTSLNAGSFLLTAPASAAANYFWGGRGSAAIVGITTASSYAAPITNVLTGIGDISGDLSAIRVNGVAAGQSTADQGTGNFLAYPLYIGMRAGAQLPFKGNLYGLIIRFGPNLGSTEIANAETWLAARSGVTL